MSFNFYVMMFSAAFSQGHAMNSAGSGGGGSPNKNQYNLSSPEYINNEANVRPKYSVEDALTALFFILEEGDGRANQWTDDQVRRLQQIFENLSLEQLLDSQLIEWMEGKSDRIGQAYQNVLSNKEKDRSFQLNVAPIEIPQIVPSQVNKVISLLQALNDEPKNEAKQGEWTEDQKARLKPLFNSLSLEQLQDPELMKWVNDKSIHFLHAYDDAIVAKESLIFTALVEEVEKKQGQLQGQLYFATSLDGNHPGMLRRVNSSGRDNNCLLYSIIGDNLELLVRIMGDKNQALEIFQTIDSGNAIQQYLQGFANIIGIYGPEGDKEANELLIQQLEFLPLVEQQDRKEILDTLQDFINKNINNMDEKKVVQQDFLDLSARLAAPKQQSINNVEEEYRDYQQVRRKIFDDILRAMEGNLANIAPENQQIIARFIGFIRDKAEPRLQGKSVKEFLDNLYATKALLFHEFASIISLMYGINVKVLQQSVNSSKVLTPSEYNEGMYDFMQGYNPQGPVIYVYNPGVHGVHYQKLRGLD